MKWSAKPLRGPMLWALGALSSFAISYLLTPPSHGYTYQGIGPELLLAATVMASLLVPIAIGFMCQRYQSQFSIKSSFVLTSLILSVLCYLSFLLSNGLIRRNPVPTPGAPSILVLMDLGSAVEIFLTYGLTTGFMGGAIILVGAAFSQRGRLGTAFLGGEQGGTLRHAVPWLLAATLPVAALGAWNAYAVYVDTHTYPIPTYLPFVNSALSVAAVPASAVLGYLSQMHGQGFSLKRSFILPIALAFLEFWAFQSYIYGFSPVTSGAYALPFISVLSATVILPDALKVGGLVAAGAIFARMRDIRGMTRLRPILKGETK